MTERAQHSTGNAPGNAGETKDQEPQEKDRRRIRGAWPYIIGGLIVAVVATVVLVGWQVSNSNAFCGDVCHGIMFPYVAVWDHSTHNRVDCVECHMGRTSLLDRLPLKATHFRELYGLITGRYETPLVATTLRPARVSCELCHYPPQFFTDTIVESRRHLDDRENTPQSTWLILKTGGGRQREGLGFGIHWHIENQIYYYSTSEFQQEIPWMRVEDGEQVSGIYMDVNFQPPEGFPKESDLRLLDCIDCHNRVGHSMLSPEQIVDGVLFRKQISDEIPYIRREALKVLGQPYTTLEEAKQGIQQLDRWYAENYAPAYAALRQPLQNAIQVLQEQYETNFFPEQGYDWQTYPDNTSHLYFPGCFRCHDGKHVSPDGKVVRIECNLCHSIPEVVTGGAGPTVSLTQGPEPSSHTDTAWLHRHREVFDASCSLCHTTGNPGGADDSSFCANSACHGVVWKFADLNAPGLAERLGLQPPAPPAGATEVVENPTYVGYIGQLLTEKCGQCHGVAAGLDVTTFASLLAGASSGPVIIPGNPDESTLIQILREGHFVTLSETEMDALVLWIQNGAPER